MLIFVPRWLLSTNTENITGNDGLAVTKAGNHLFSTQLLPKLTCTGELLPAGAGEPTKPMVLAEKLWQGLAPVPWPALALHVSSTRRILLLLVAFVEIQQGSEHRPLVQEVEKSICRPQDVLHRCHLLSFALSICLLSWSNTFTR